MSIFSSIGNFLGDVVGGLTGASQASDAAQAAAKTQAQASQAGIAEQRRQFDKLVELMAPYVSDGTRALGGLQQYADAGAPALEQMQALSGSLGAEAQREAINNISQSPLYQDLAAQGESALLQNASATGGLRGGNLQGALAQYRPQLLSQLINDQYSKLGGLTNLGSQTLSNITQLGQSAAAGQGSAGLQSANVIGNLLGQQGAAVAGGQLAKGNSTRQAFTDALNIASAATSLF